MVVANAVNDRLHIVGHGEVTVEDGVHASQVPLSFRFRPMCGPIVTPIEGEPFPTKNAVQPHRWYPCSASKYGHACQSSPRCGARFRRP